jgi:hypothetical protein
LSHLVTIKTQLKDPVAIRAACQRLSLPPPREGTFQLFNSPAIGIAVQLPGWVYPVVCNPQSGELQYDNFEERWGKKEHLDAFMQMYAVEKARLEAHRRGHDVTETQLADGSIKLTIQVGGAAQ